MRQDTLFIGEGALMGKSERREERGRLGLTLGQCRTYKIVFRS